MRDYFRTHPDMCRQYAARKLRQAKQYPYDMDGHCDGKDQFVAQLRDIALDWKKNKSSSL